MKTPTIKRNIETEVVEDNINLRTTKTRTGTAIENFLGVLASYPFGLLLDQEGSLSGSARDAVEDGVRPSREVCRHCLKDNDDMFFGSFAENIWIDVYVNNESTMKRDLCRPVCLVSDSGGNVYVCRECPFYMEHVLSSVNRPDGG